MRGYGAEDVLIESCRDLNFTRVFVGLIYPFSSLSRESNDFPGLYLPRTRSPVRIKGPRGQDNTRKTAANNQHDPPAGMFCGSPQRGIPAGLFREFGHSKGFQRTGALHSKESKRIRGRYADPDLQDDIALPLLGSQANPDPHRS